MDWQLGSLARARALDLRREADQARLARLARTAQRAARVAGGRDAGRSVSPSLVSPIGPRANRIGRTSPSPAVDQASESTQVGSKRPTGLASAGPG